MEAPDKHWLLVKQHWQPLEQLLSEAGAGGENAQVQIDSLADRLPSGVIDKLHRARISRNQVVHGNQPLGDEEQFRKACEEATAALHGLLGRRSSPTSTDSPLKQRFKSYLFMWAVVAGLLYAYRSADKPLGAWTWRVAEWIYTPLIWATQATLDLVQEKDLLLLIGWVIFSGFMAVLHEGIAGLIVLVVLGPITLIALVHFGLEFGQWAFSFVF